VASQHTGKRNARKKGKGKARSTGNTPDDVDPDELVSDVAHRLQIARDDILVSSPSSRSRETVGEEEDPSRRMV
jgi:hypothetical protein